jgi:hypothetical protein
MKRTITSLLFITFMSCGPSHPLTYVEIQQFGDQSLHGFTLVDAHDSVIVVRPAYSWNNGGQNINVPASKVDRIFIQRNNTGSGILGCAVGGLAGIGATALIINSDHSNNALSVVSDVFLSVLASYALMGTGAYVGCKIADNMEQIDLGTPDTWKLLKTRSESFDKD